VVYNHNIPVGLYTIHIGYKIIIMHSKRVML